MSSTKVQEVTHKRLASPDYATAHFQSHKRSRRFEDTRQEEQKDDAVDPSIITKKQKSDKATSANTNTSIPIPVAEASNTSIETISQISFDKRHQSVLSVIHFKQPLKIQTEYPIPEISPYEILVQNKAIGLNPIDWKGKKYGFGIYHFPWINGRESSGDIVKVGSKVNSTTKDASLSVGDKVIVSSTSYRDNRTSTFQHFTAIDSRLVWKLPHHFTYEDGATIGVGLVTAGILFYSSFGFDLTATPSKRKGTLLIWGGSTIVGIYVAQLAKLHGLTVISIAGTRHAEYLKSLGVDYVIDRFLSDDEIEAKANEYSPDGMDYGIDCVSKETAIKVLNILDANSGKLKHYSKVGPESNSEATQESAERSPLFAGVVGVPKEDQAPKSVVLKPVIIKRFHEDVDFGAQFIQVTSNFLAESKIKPARYKQFNGGLEIIEDALNDLEKIGANGEKYVVSIRE
ncbi:hypothetical protein KGF57_005286 [Candida theae]|uniref:Enoyl reductase (ER) domain-containing protein n=1 Tax=Candida theae TaxID=1198502 RepID=A0AAD5B8X5_9ASCO|nr:uncharacterized protein KGF57_005286 [Candida theae]KAI5948675.1 hypothetical protein KGF57_005286 [Candida theae]